MKPIALIVEDNEVFRDVFAATLTREGWDVVTAMDGDDGLKKWVSAKWDLVITDYDMPGTNGVGLTRQIREWETAHGERAQQIVYMLSASPEARKPFLAAGGNAYFDKLDTTAWRLAVRTLRVVLEPEDRCGCTDCEATEDCHGGCEDKRCRGCAARHADAAEAEYEFRQDR